MRARTSASIIAPRRRSSRRRSSKSPSPSRSSDSPGHGIMATQATEERASAAPRSKVSSQRGVAQKAPGPSAASAARQRPPVHSARASHSVRTPAGWRGQCGSRAFKRRHPPSVDQHPCRQRARHDPSHSCSAASRASSSARATSRSRPRAQVSMPDVGAQREGDASLSAGGARGSDAGGQRAAAAQDGSLIARPRGVQRRPAHRRRAPAAAVPLAPITVRAEQENLRAWHPSTHHEP